MDEKTEAKGAKVGVDILTSRRQAINIPDLLTDFFLVHFWISSFSNMLFSSVLSRSGDLQGKSPTGNNLLLSVNIIISFESWSLWSER